MNKASHANHAAFGEHMAYKRQARDAALRRLALLHNLAAGLHQAAERVAEPFDAAAAQAQIEAAARADREMRAALARANQAAALCGEPDVHLAQLLREQD